jgi:hypothetical protein
MEFKNKDNVEFNEYFNHVVSASVTIRSYKLAYNVLNITNL